ncbi:vascular endothelial growth factor receptor 1-like [Macrosteles quadrilineatus]|uniref:vascular endothelial growth factor receptor 1-like n=1 Tax=Macrosteles quadrilineatus TaxID=74068 RepID=UPI0023E2A8E2|nr:vascular endothelial growth factor receptor 1-like [Macrosteles quadrilineatus]
MSTWKVREATVQDTPGNLEVTRSDSTRYPWQLGRCEKRQYNIPLATWKVYEKRLYKIPLETWKGREATIQDTPGNLEGVRSDSTIYPWQLRSTWKVREATVQYTPGNLESTRSDSTVYPWQLGRYEKRLYKIPLETWKGREATIQDTPGNLEGVRSDSTIYPWQLRSTWKVREATVQYTPGNLESTRSDCTVYPWQLGKYEKRQYSIPLATWKVREVTAPQYLKEKLKARSAVRERRTRQDLLLDIPRVVLDAGYVVIDFPEHASTDRDLVVDTGSIFDIKCREYVNITWYYDDTLWKEYEEYEDMGVKDVMLEKMLDGEYVSTLTIRGAYYLDTGYYTCYPVHEGRESAKTQSIYLYVNSTDPEQYLALPKEKKFIQVYMSEVLNIPCRPTNPNLKVQLKKDDKVVPAKYDPHKGFELNTTAVNQGGYFKCVYSDNITSNELDLLVEISNKKALEQPEVNISPTDVMEGDNVTLKCKINHDSNVTISWAFPHIFLETSKRIHQHELKKVVNDDFNYFRELTLTNASKQDEGEYTCKVADDAGNQNSKSVKLSVNPAGLIPITLDIRGYTSGGNKTFKNVNVIQILVDIIARPPTTIQWYDHNKSRISGTVENVEVKNNPSLANLTIHQPTINNTGTYYLEVNNSASSRTVDFTVLIEGAPSLHHNKEKSVVFYMVNSSLTIDWDVQALPSPNMSCNSTSCPDYPSCSNSTQENQIRLQETDIRTLFKYRMDILGDDPVSLECKACNSLGCASKVMEILVTDEDVEDGMSIDVPDEVAVGDRVVLRCSASKYIYTTYPDWRFKENDVVSAIIDTQITEETKYSYVNKILIPEASKNHSGEYICSAMLLNERNQTRETKTALDVRDLEKPLIIKDVTKLIVPIGQFLVELLCIAQGFPTPIISWYKNDETITKETHENIRLLDNNWRLVIESVGLEDYGSYRCEATNKGGTDELIINIENSEPGIIMFSMFIPRAYLIMILSPLIAVVLFVAILVYILRVRSQRAMMMMKENFAMLNPNIKYEESINPEIDIAEQVHLLPYDGNKWNFPRSKLKLERGTVLGSGEFGVVLKAKAYGIVESGVATTVAVKKVKRHSDRTLVEAFALELKMMIYLGSHRNVANVLGACTDGELMVIVEYCEYGCLGDYIWKYRDNFIKQEKHTCRQCGSNYNKDTTSDSVSNLLIDLSDEADVSEATDLHSLNKVAAEDEYCKNCLINWSYQVAAGMEYVASKGVVHGDLALRNILLAENNVVKICDFGLSKRIYQNAQYMKKNKNLRLPLKWMALESILYEKYTSKSDVWSYGIVLWEIFSLSGSPYADWELDGKFKAKLIGGERMKKPTYAPNHVYDIMMNCWERNPNSRPSFTEIMEKMLPNNSELLYVEMNSQHEYVNTGATQVSCSTSTVISNAGYMVMEPAASGNNRLNDNPVHCIFNPSYLIVERPNSNPSANEDVNEQCTESV